MRSSGTKGMYSLISQDSKRKKEKENNRRFRVRVIGRFRKLRRCSKSSKKLRKRLRNGPRQR